MNSCKLVLRKSSNNPYENICTVCGFEYKTEMFTRLPSSYKRDNSKCIVFVPEIIVVQRCRSKTVENICVFFSKTLYVSGKIIDRGKIFKNQNRNYQVATKKNICANKCKQPAVSSQKSK